MFSSPSSSSTSSRLPLSGFVAILLGTLPLSAACAPSIPQEAPAADKRDGAPANEPPPPSTPELTTVLSAELLPYAPNTPWGQAAAGLRDAINATEDGDSPRALAALDRAALTADLAPDLRRWLRGENLQLLDPTGATKAWARIPTTSRRYPDALLARADALLQTDQPSAVLDLLGPTRDALVLPSAVKAGLLWQGRADILRTRALVARQAPGDETLAYAASKRVWTELPRTGPGIEAEHFMDGLAARVPPGLHPDLADKVRRSAPLGRGHQNDAIIALLGAETSALKKLQSTDPATACEGQLQLGRAFHKKRQYKDSIPLLDWAASHCDEESSAIKALYLQAQGESRSGRSADAVKHFTLLADRYPASSYADDGLFHAGNLELQEGETDAARGLFLRQIREFPDGDMVAKTLWGLSWAALTDERPVEALPFLRQLSDGDPLGKRREQVLQGRYWLAMASLAADPSRSAEVLEDLDKLASQRPLHYYGLLALWRLNSLDPSRAQDVIRRSRDRVKALREGPTEQDRFKIEADFLVQPGIREGISLLRAGLPTEAAEELARALGSKPAARWSQATLLFASHLLQLAQQPDRSHNLLRAAFRSRFPALTAEHRSLFLHAYPRAFSAQIERATQAHSYPPLVFQSLIREESAFQAGVVSWAGAIGLSQLMWSTARETAKRMGIRGLRKADLRDPQTNLNIGTYYFEGLLKRWSGHLPLAIASYNAGPGAVKRWVAARGDLDLDAWVETIPYDQTRHYVKRVVQSYQIYSLLYEDEPYVPLRTGPVAAALRETDPKLP